MTASQRPAHNPIYPFLSEVLQRLGPHNRTKELNAFTAFTLRSNGNWILLDYNNVLR